MSDTSEHDCDDVCGNFKIHPRRKVCNECKLPWECHALTDKDIKDIQETLKSLRGEYPQSNSDYAWVPPQCPKDRLEEYFKDFSENEVPKYDSEGFKWRFRTLRKQIPETDISPSACRFVEPEMTEKLKDFTNSIKNKSLHFGFVQEWSKGMPLQCPTCMKMMEEGELVVVPTKNSSKAYHPACFNCSICGQHLADLVNCFDVDGEIHCVRDFAETLKPRCKACDELIFSDRFKQAGEAAYHSDHQRCFNCEDPLQKTSYDHEGELHCLQCYEKMHGDNCDKCGQIIPVDTKHIEYKGKFWHVKCFKCELCGEVTTEFEDVDDKFYCIKCYNKEIAIRCETCKQIISNVDEYIKFEGMAFHINCFKCQDCLKIIGTAPFLANGGIAYCKECHTRRFAIRCYRCKHPITDGEIIKYDQQPFHVGCFTCHICQTRLGNQVFKKVNDNIYCKPCFTETFCKKCHSCGQPIVLGTSDVLYSYGEIKWHSECFICRICERSLIDTKFIMQGTDLICEGCTSKEDTFSATASQGQSNDRRFSTLENRSPSGSSENQRKSSSGSSVNHRKCSTSGSSENHHRCSNSRSSENRISNKGASEKDKDKENEKKNITKDPKKDSNKSNDNQEKSE